MYINKKEYIFYYLDNKYSIISIQKNSKLPEKSWKEFQKRFISPEEIDSFNWHNIAIVTGKISNLIVIDADTKQTIDFLENNFPIFNNTKKIKTRRGIHYYFRVYDIPDDYTSSKIYVNDIKIDIKANNAYVVCPPSIIDDFQYHPINTIPEINITFSEFKALISKIKSYLNPSKKKSFTDLLNLIKKYYTEGNRQFICLYISGWFRKENVSKEETENFILTLCNETNDRDIKQRLSAVEETWEKDDLSQLKGIQGLIELGINENELLSFFSKRKKYSFIERDEFVYIQQKNETVMIGPKIKILSKIIDNTDVLYEISFDDKNDIIKEIKDFEKIRKFTGYGITKENKYLEWLNNQAAECSIVKHIRRSTGWHHNEFYHPALQPDDIWENFIFKKIKTYEKNKNEQHNLIKFALKDGKALGFIYCFCLASVLNEIINCNPSVCFISGPARVGKTTLAQLGINLFLPSKHILLTTNSTQTGFELTLKSIKDLPLLFDECMLNSVDLEKIVFMVASKTGKIRGTKNLSINVSELNSNVMFTSEALETSKFMSTGAKRRFIGLSIYDFNENCLSTFTSEQIQKYKECFGAGLDLIKFIKSNLDSIYPLAERNEKDIDMCKLNPFFNTIKPILTALDTFQLFYNEEFNNMRAYITNIFFEQKKEFEQKINIIYKFKDSFSEFLIKKTNSIIDSSNGKHVKGDIIGQKEENDVYILTSIFSEFCLENKFEQKILIQELIKSEILKPHGKNAHRKMKRINGIAVPTYHIDLKKLDEVTKNE